MIAALILCAAALTILPGRVCVPVRPSAGTSSRSSGITRRRRAVVAGGAVGAMGVLLFPDRWWVAVATGLFGGLLVGRRPAGRSVRRRRADRGAVAMHADLFAACLEAGMAVAPALRAVSDAMTSAGVFGEAKGADGGLARDRVPDGGGGTGHAGTGKQADRSGRDPIGENTVGRARSGPLVVLDSVAAMLALGADPHTAWRAADAVEELAPLAAAARRSAEGGGGLAEAVREHAALLRADDAATDLRAAARAGVLMTAPLGVCFLPAFLCLGLAPVVVGLLGQLDIF